MLVCVCHYHRPASKRLKTAASPGKYEVAVAGHIKLCSMQTPRRRFLGNLIVVGEGNVCMRGVQWCSSVGSGTLFPLSDFSYFIQLVKCWAHGATCIAASRASEEETTCVGSLRFLKGHSWTIIAMENGIVYVIGLAGHHSALHFLANSVFFSKLSCCAGTVCRKRNCIIY